MYQILFDGRVVRVGYETEEEVEKAKRDILSEFEKKVTMRRLEPRASAYDVASAKREYEAAKKDADAFNKELPNRLAVMQYDVLHEQEPDD